MPAEQFFLVSVSRMMTSDECDIVPSWSGVIPESKLVNFGALKLSADLTELKLREDTPVTNLRPMTEEEIGDYREAQRAED